VGSTAVEPEEDSEKFTPSESAEFLYSYNRDFQLDSITTKDGTADYGYNSKGELDRIDMPGSRDYIQFAYGNTPDEVNWSDREGNQITYDNRDPFLQHENWEGDIRARIVRGYDDDGLISHQLYTETYFSEVAAYGYDAKGRLDRAEHLIIKTAEKSLFRLYSTYLSSP